MVESLLDIDTFSEWLILQTQSAKHCLTSQLSTWHSEPQKVQQLSEKFKRFKDAFDRDPTFYGQCHTILGEIAEMEAELTTLLDSKSDLERESYGEILFFKPLLQPLNFVPYLLTWWSMVRVYLLPGLSLLVPILTMIAPYLIITYVFNIPITFSRYMNMLQVMISGQFKEMMNMDAVDSVQWSSIPVATLLKQLGVITMTFLQGILQPYWTHQHLKSVDSIITNHGQLVRRFRESYQRLEALLQEHGFTFFRCPLPELSNDRDATARALLQSTYFKMALKYVGHVEVLIQLAHQPEIQAVRWVKAESDKDPLGPKPIFRIQDTFDYQVPEEKRKTLSAKLDRHRHALLTGPNKGGKSTVLRALATSAQLAHTYGCAFGTLTATPFSKMFVCLKPDDLPGSKSRFEREIEFTASTLAPSQPILVFIDELYHSTNPPDALRSCEIYAAQLWRKTNVVSVVSTHLFDWVEKAPKEIQRLCCPAHHDKEGILHFQYELHAGICKVSSVEMLLEKNGLSKI
jgi:hypothetical protein